MKGNVLWAALVAGALIGFLLGKWNGKTSARADFADHVEIVKDIAELAVLEIDGMARLTESNSSMERNFWNDLSDFFGERTLQLDVPYQAKFGVDLAKSDLKIVREKGEVRITMEKPDLKSFELRLDRLKEFSRNGAFVFQKDNRLKLPLQKLYTETRKKLQNKDEYRLQSQAKIEQVMQHYYDGLDLKVKIKWVN